MAGPRGRLTSIARFQRDLARYQRVLLETTAIVAFLDGADPATPLAEEVFQRLEQGVLEGYAAAVTACELLLGPPPVRLPTCFPSLGDFLQRFPNLEVVPLDFLVAFHTAELCRRSGLRLPECAILASGMVAGCQALVTTDDAWADRIKAAGTPMTCLSLPGYLA